MHHRERKPANGRLTRKRVVIVSAASATAREIRHAPANVAGSALAVRNASIMGCTKVTKDRIGSGETTAKIGPGPARAGGVAAGDAGTGNRRMKAKNDSSVP